MVAHDIGKSHSLLNMPCTFNDVWGRISDKRYIAFYPSQGHDLNNVFCEVRMLICLLISFSPIPA